MPDAVMRPGNHGGRLRTGGGRPPSKGLTAEWFKTFENGDKKSNLKPRKDRLYALLKDKDPGIRFQVEKLLLEQQHGRPPVREEEGAAGHRVGGIIVILNAPRPDMDTLPEAIDVKALKA